MADYNKLIQLIKSSIKPNGNKEITGSILQDVLLSMVDNYPSVPDVPGVIDGLNSTSQTDALSANQGRLLNEAIENLPDVPDVIDNLESSSAVDALSAKQGKALYDMIQSGAGMNYQKMTQAEYDAAYQAGTLSYNILYIIVG